ncbi:MAG: LPS assembly lipoprotein LptE [Bacteroidetes bacterium]|nr:LPS assembly lipoprotein LptE [Bacteroidota bacterium]
MKVVWLLKIVLLFSVSGCTYSFKGGSVPPHLRTIAIPIVEDQTGSGNPILRESMTKQLTTAFLNDNTLQVTDRNTADAILEAVILDMKDAPAVLEGVEKVTQRRVTLSVRATLYDQLLRRKLWEKSFSGWGYYPSGSSLTQQNEGITEAIRKISEDILNETVAGW